jgi:hypothetical protein
MRVTVYYDSLGAIKSVVLVNPEAGTQPVSKDYASIEIDLDDVSPKSLAELHAGNRVDTEERRLLRR